MTSSASGNGHASPPHGDIDDTLQAFMALVPRLVAELAHRTGMSRSEVEALQHMAVQPLGPSELAQRLGLTPSAATLVIDRLQERGHVTREPDPADGRRVQAMPSDAAIGEVLGHLMPMLVALNDAESEFTSDERAAIRRYLELASDAVLRVLTPDPSRSAATGR